MMSVHALSAAFAARGLSPSEKLVLLSLANYADEDGRCWPSQRRMAAETSLSDRTVRSVLSALEEKGLIRREERQREDGSRASDVITLTLGERAQISGGAETVSGGVATISGGVRKQFPGGAEMVSGLTTFEPSTDPSEEPKRAARGARKPAKDEIEAIWAIVPRLARERSSRADLATALEAAMRRGHNPADVLRGLQAAYASATYSGDHAKGVHRLIERDRWASFEQADACKPHTPLAWNGPPALLAALRAEMGAHADAFLRLSRWDAERGAIVTTSPTAADRLKRDAGHVLRAEKVEIILEQAA